MSPQYKIEKENNWYFVYYNISNQLWHPIACTITYWGAKRVLKRRVNSHHTKPSITKTYYYTEDGVLLNE